MKEFTGKTAVVTGAASGIGRGLADRFAAEGMRVVLADVEAPALERAEQNMKSAGATVLAVRTDVSKPEDVEALAARAEEAFGAVHVLCNNAGVGSGGFSWEQSLEDWQWVLGVNLWGVIHGIRTFVPKMLKHGEDGHIVNTASMAGLVAGPFMSPYNVSKYGVVALSETLHKELALTNAKIKVSVLCPGFVRTNIADSSRNRPNGATGDGASRDFSSISQMNTSIRQMLAEGMPPSEVAGLVFDAIAHERFYVLTHPRWKEDVRKRMEDIIEDRSPSRSQIG